MADDTPLLDRIHTPDDLKQLAAEQLPALVDELRQELIRVVSHTGGHLGAGLGVVELTVALHYLFDTPNDRLIWDVGHQAYPHKILTGRRERMLGALERWGYRLTRPEGTFYLWGAAPGGDAVRFADALAERGVLVMPGTLFERPGDFRISLTANAEMIERALPAFQAVA